jgi:hypothetical protein
MTDWHTGEWLHMGIADVEPQSNGTLLRRPFEPYVEALRQWQHRLGRPTRLDQDPYDKAVDLADVIRAAASRSDAPDKNWH